MEAKDCFYILAGLKTPEQFKAERRKAEVSSIFQDIDAGLIEESLTAHIEPYDPERRSGKTTSRVIEAIYQEFLGNEVFIIGRNEMHVKQLSGMYNDFKRKIIKTLEIPNKSTIIISNKSKYNLCRSKTVSAKVIEDLD